MDIFGRNRTFLVIFGLIVLFVVFIMQYWNTFASAESFSNLRDTYPDSYNMGQWVTINGDVPIGDDNPQKRYEGGYLKKTSNNNVCTYKCNQQPECSKIHGNECRSEVMAHDGNCYCAFRRIQDNFQGMDDKPLIQEGFEANESVLDFTKRTLIQLPNAPTPSATFLSSKTNDGSGQVSCKQLEQNLDVARWKDLGIDSRDAMSMSFWIYFDEAVLMTNWNWWIPILHIVHPNYPGQGVSWYGNDRFIGIWLRQNAPVLHARSITMTRNGKNINGNDGAPSYEEIARHRVGFDPRPAWMTFTYHHGVMKIFKNGECMNTVTSRYVAFVEPPPDAKLVLNRGNKKGIYMTDLKFYNHVISEIDVRYIYKSIEKDCPNCWETSFKEGFSAFSFKSPFSTMMTNVNNVLFNKKEGFLTNGSVNGENGINEKLCHNKMYPSTKDNASALIQSDESVIREFRKKISNYGFDVWKKQQRPTPRINMDNLTKINKKGKICAIHGKNAGAIHPSGNLPNTISDSQGSNKNGASTLSNYDEAHIFRKGNKVDLRNELNGLLQNDINKIYQGNYDRAKWKDCTNDSDCNSDYKCMSSGIGNNKGRCLDDKSCNWARDYDAFRSKTPKGDCKPKPVGFDFKDDDKIVITIKHGHYNWVTLKTLEYFAKDWKTNMKGLLTQMKKDISDTNTDKTEPKYTCNDNELCSGYTGWVKWGKCSKPTGPDNNLVATVPLKYCDKTRNIKYTQLNGEEHLEINQRLNYNQNGCTFSMWFKVDEDKIQPQYKKRWWKRLVNFGTPYKWYMEDELIIAIGGDGIHHTMDFYIKNGEKRSHIAYTIRQVMDGNWHHIIWVIQNGRWTFYHNGDKMWSAESTWAGPPLMPKNTPTTTDSRQVVGAPAVFWDPYPQPCIGEFEIINRPIEDNEAWVMYIKE